MTDINTKRIPLRSSGPRSRRPRHHRRSEGLGYPVPAPASPREPVSGFRPHGRARFAPGSRPRSRACRPWAPPPDVPRPRLSLPLRQTISDPAKGVGSARKEPPARRFARAPGRPRIPPHLERALFAICPRPSRTLIPSALTYSVKLDQTRRSDHLIRRRRTARSISRSAWPTGSATKTGVLRHRRRVRHPADSRDPAGQTKNRPQPHPVTRTANSTTSPTAIPGRRVRILATLATHLGFGKVTIRGLKSAYEALDSGAAARPAR